MTIPAEPDQANSGPSLRWAITAIVVVVLVYPLAVWLREAGVLGTTGPSITAAEAALQRSVEAYQVGRYQDAIDAARAALADNPDLAEAYNNIAVSSLRLRNYDEGIAAAREALRLQPEYELARNNLAWLEREKAAAGNATGVQQLMEEGIDLLYKRNKPGEAAARFQQVLALNPEHYGANYQLAAALQQAGRFDEARSQWIKVLGMARAINDTQTEALILPHLNPADIEPDSQP